MKKPVITAGTSYEAWSSETMNYRTIHPQFQDTFAYYPNIPQDTRETLWNYLAYGLQPGGFITSVLENNFLSASCRADAFWTQAGFKELALWIIHHMPLGSYGSAEAIKNWMSKTDEERLEIMIELGLRPGEFDILRGIAVP